MAETTTDSPWTDEDVERAAVAYHADSCGCTEQPTGYDRDRVVTVLDELAPRVAELQRAAKVEALREAGRDFHGVTGDWAFVECWLDDRADAIERGVR